MTIQPGEHIQNVKLRYMTADGPRETNVNELFGGKKVVLFGVPGAFTPTCSAKHLPGFVRNYEALRNKGVDLISCISTNDVFVMHAWARDQKSDGKVLVLADGNGDFARVTGTEADFTSYGLGHRNHRYAMIIEDGVVTHVAMEELGAFKVSSAEAVLEHL